MRYTQLKAIANWLATYQHIKKARRVGNNIIEINLGEDESLFFDMTRGSSTIYLAPSKRPSQDFNAPFDTILHQNLSHSKILAVAVEENERILKITVQPKSQYKNRQITIQLEFTGRHSNAILIDEQGVILEALRHIDSHQSYRIVRPGVQLEPLIPRPQKDLGNFDGDIVEWLRENYKKIHSKELISLRKQKRQQIERKRDKTQKLLNELPDEEILEKEAQRSLELGNIILANLHKIKPYDRELKTLDFEGANIIVPLPKDITKNRLAEYYFNQAKRTRSKAKNIYIERKNLEDKLKFYENIIQAINEAKEPYDLELLVPKQGRSKRKKEKLRYGELYWIEGYKVYVGCNARENQKLLELARSNDIWMHVRDIAGSHVIIRTDKQNLPESILRSASKLCVDFTTSNAGNYKVDYTRRKFVKIQEGSSVEYDKYKTINVLKEGIEIRK